jgi:VWFA-related protein
MKKIFTLSIIAIFILTGFEALAQSNSGTPVTNKKANRRASEDSSKPKEKPNFTNQDVIDESIEADDGIIKVETNLVTIPVKVTDRNGRFIAGLTKEDFKVWEDKTEQKIEYFQNEEKPFTVALVLDMSYSSTFKIDEIQQAALTFITQLRPADQVMVISFDQEVHILSEPTSDRKKLEQAIIRTRISSGTSLYETVDFVINKRFNKIQGRKAIVLFTDGVDTTSREKNENNNLRDAMEFDALIYPIQYDTFNDVQAIQNKSVIIKEPSIQTTPPTMGGSIPTGQTPGNPLPFPLPTGTVRVGGGGGRNTNNGEVITTRGPVGTDRNGRTTTRNPQPVPRSLPGSGTSREEYDRADQYLEEMSLRTGGRVYKASNSFNLTQAFSKIASELREFYSLGYYPEEEKAGGSKRKIKVKVDRKGVAVRARDSYVVKNKSEKK